MKSGSFVLLAKSNLIGWQRLVVPMLACQWMVSNVCCLSFRSKSCSFCAGRREGRLFVRAQESAIVDRRLVLGTLFSSWCLTSNTKESYALSPQEASQAYDAYAPRYDELDGGKVSTILGLDEARAQLFRNAQGHVLEIGVGTGMNIPKYDFKKLSSLTLVDVSEGMLQEARARTIAQKPDIPVNFVKADATSGLVSIFGKNRFDTVVDSFSLCVMGNEGARQCLLQLWEVVKAPGDGGKVLLLENTRSSMPVLGMYQDATAKTAAAAGGKGCVYNQDVGELLRSTGRFSIEKETPYVAGLFRAFECTKRVSNNSPRTMSGLISST